MEMPAALPDFTTRILLHLWKRCTVTVDALSIAAGATTAQTLQSVDMLQRLGCVIERTPSGLEIHSVGLSCWRDILENASAARRGALGRSVHIYKQTGSTNDLALHALVDDARRGLVVIADEQTAGRGRRGHSWLAKRGQSILLSVLVPAQTGQEDRLTLITGLVVAETLELFGISSVQIKWPNDLLIAGQKIAGVLVESRPAHTVIGLGINVAQSTADFPPELRAQATSVYLASGQVVDRLRIIEALIAALEKKCTADALADPRWLEGWKGRCPMLGQTLTAFVSDAQGKAHPVTGQVLNVDPLKGLLLRDETGAMVWLSAKTTALSPR